MNKTIGYSLLIVSVLLPFLVNRNVRIVSAQNGSTLSGPISGPTATPTAIPTLSSTITPTPTRKPTPTPTKKPTPTPTVKPIPTIKPTNTPAPKPTIAPIPTPRPIINRPPVISNKAIYSAVKGKSFSYFIAITDRENDRVTSRIFGIFPAGVNSLCNTSGCYIGGISQRIGLFFFRIEAVDARGAKSIATSILVVTNR